MASQVFYRKWRPQTLAEVVGQEHVTTTLLNALRTGRVAHAYLFCGPRGTGKTSTGRILAKAVNCTESGQGEPCNSCEMCRAVTEGRATDVIEVDAASNRGIDEVRDLRERARFAPNVARYKVYIVDEVHMLTEPAANALLKTLEEPPPHVIFVLATTESHKVPATILSRCQRFDFRRISQAAMVSRLAELCGHEGIRIEEASLKLIARSATGSMRDAENLLDQLVAYHGAEVDVHQVESLLGMTGDARVRDLARHLVSRDITAGLQTINSVVQDGVDLRHFNRELVEYLRGLLLVKAGAPQAVDLSAEAVEEMQSLAGAAPMEHLSRAVKLFRQVDQEFDGFSTLPLELALVECALADNDEEDRPAEEMPARVRRAPARPVAAAKQKTAPPQAAAASAEPSAEPAPREEFQEVTLPECTDDVDYLRRRWRDVVQATKGMGSSGNLDALLRSACEPVALEDDTIVLGFFYNFHKEKIEDPKYRHMVEKKASEIFGKTYKIRCILVDRDKKEPVQKREPRGHLVDEALRMGGRIVQEAD
ncbi:MAG: DNA polymerase III subunit gamma/tau [Chloroflexota bacterium]|nr:DNA polymerase III subunit gamma/tau [Chloroflexota bacterium]